jgi:uncharacterized protein involved in exopolysaccharide biosynthesis
LYFLEAPLRRPPLVLAPVLFLSLAAAAIALSMPPRYRAAALLRAEWDKAHEALQQERGGDVAARRTQTLRQRATERQLLERVAREASPYGPAAAGSSLDEATTRLPSDLRVRPMSSSSFAIEFEHRDPAMAARVPNALARQLAEADSDGRPTPIVRFELLREAAIPQAKESPSPALLVLAGALAGLVTGLVAAVVSEHRDRRVKGPEDLEDILPVPLLATLPDLQARGRRRA